jgi:heparosan-N-sulfate-glucuronate 5-epimerase
VVHALVTEFGAGLMGERTGGARAHAFRPGDPHEGYYIDLRPKPLSLGGSPATALAALRRLTADRRTANAVTIVQLALGAWQLGEVWREVVARATDWLVSAMGEDGKVPYLFALPHTYPLEAPWYSAMAQGEIASLLVRASRSLDAPELVHPAVSAVQSLVDRNSLLVVATPDGPVLQEYATNPPAHVLNGWISALWGLYDVAHAPEAGAAVDRCLAAFRDGAACLSRRLPRYRTPLYWSRYDLFPHPVVNVATPFYHRLHVDQLEAIAALAPDATVAGIAAEWRRGTRSVPAHGLAFARKLAFRAIRPRRPVAA